MPVAQLHVTSCCGSTVSDRMYLKRGWPVLWAALFFFYSFFFGRRSLLLWLRYMVLSIIARSFLYSLHHLSLRIET